MTTAHQPYEGAAPFFRRNPAWHTPRRSSGRTAAAAAGKGEAGAKGRMQQILQRANPARLLPGARAAGEPSSSAAEAGGLASLDHSAAPASSRRVELGVFAALLLLANWPLFFGGTAGALAYSGEAVKAGQWWRLFTCAFAHVSPYHLLLDGAAFLLLYGSLAAGRLWQRLALVVGAGAGSLATAVALSPLIAERGLCGLSGVDHGLMAVAALEALTGDRSDRAALWMSAVALLGVVGKCAVELVMDGALFTSLHFGQMGVPIVACHAGGVMGAALAWLALRRGSEADKE